MAVKFTDDQQKVIDTRNQNILVSAAAGSGKTAVLVERIIKRIMDPVHPIDIDRLLVVTFTNAAAAGMKERISNAIQARLALEPGNAHLQKQAVLVHQALITTIHSFCLYLIKNHFEAIGLEPDFKVADEAIIKLLAAEVKEEILEEAFKEATEDFTYMVEFICHNGRESSLEEYIDQLYNRAMSMPFPKSWLLQRKKDYDFTDLDVFTATDSGKYLFLHIQGLIKSYEQAYKRLYQMSVEPDGPYMYAELLEAEQVFLQRILEQKSLEDIGSLLPNMEFGRLSAKKDSSVHAGKREWVKEKRSAYKKAIQAIGTQFFGKSPQSIEVENKACQKVSEVLIDLTIAYMDRLAAEKRKRGYIDFHDMEHMALEILLRETEDGYEPTEVALGYQAFFEEVMVDEYQDSNMVQEYLVTAVSGEKLGKNNRFMVGDVKQSIYKFRLARPELFMQKYHAYAQGVQGDGADDTGKVQRPNIRIDLKQNFRSRPEVLSATNSIFEKVMLPELGGIAYDEHAALYPGAKYPEAAGMEAELLIATEDRPEQYDAREWEAYCVAKRIKELIRTGEVTGEDGKLRPVTYGDIVLLFRSPSSFEDAYKRIFEKEGIPLYMTSGSGYFDSVEIQNLVKFLQVIENPRMDIPMFGVCTSVFGGMTENQLAEVKVHGRSQVQVQGQVQCLYEMLCKYQEDFPESVLGKTIARLQENLQKYRRKMQYLTVEELLYEILRDFRYREWVAVLPDGEKRMANVALFLERAANFGIGGSQGVFAFTSYMNQLRKQAVDYGEAALLEQADVVRVMSIHKSKGLEFPVAIVCGMGQAYQMRDKQQMILIDNDMGLGMDYVNPILRSKNATLRKRVIALKMEQEILAEEQRILYVAMTRAKEKLIMVGTRPKFDIYAEEEQVFSRNSMESCMLSDVLSATSYLDLCLLARDDRSPILLRTMSAEDYVICEVAETVSRQERKERLIQMLYPGADNDICPGGVYHRRVAEEALVQAYAERFDFRYAHENLQNMYSKTSVSELKKAAMKEEQEATFEAFEAMNEAEMIPYIPAFMREKEEMKGAERGTAYHKVMELLDFAAPPQNRMEWQQFLDSMVNDRKLTGRQAESIFIPNMLKFMQSDIAARMKLAAQKGSLKKEQSFFLGVPADSVDKAFPKEEIMLVQGVIDAFFEEDGALVLVDYKTDRVENGKDLLDRYRVQMQYYSKALKQALGKSVKEVVLYSISLGEEIKTHGGTLK